MQKLKAEPKYIHGDVPNIGVLLVNLGTPSDYSTSSVKRYLKEFLSDPRVVEIPKTIWWFILHGIILPFRSKKSAQKYKLIWTNEGSPLLVNTQKQTSALQKLIYRLSETASKDFNADNIKIAYAMRYNTPKISDILLQFKQQNVKQLIILPLYPQYSSTTTGSIFQNIFEELNTWRNIPSIHTINCYHDNHYYISAIAQHINLHWQKVGIPNFNKNDKLLMSFHGLPQSNLEKGDYYHCQCYKTARLIAEKLNLNKSDYLVSFQSRLGKAKRLQPYTEKNFHKLAKNKARVDVVCPGFSSDCLETLEEIAIEGKETFLSHGGKQFEYISCLNDSSHGMEAIMQILNPYISNMNFTSLAQIEVTKIAYNNLIKS